MKLGSFLAENRSTYGIVIDGKGLLDLGVRVGERYPDLRKLIEGGELPQIARQYGSVVADYNLDEVSFLPPVPKPINIISSGAIFPSHIKEMVDAGMMKAPPPFPGFHVKASSSFVGHNNALVKPKESDQLDWENEFAIIIGAPCRHVTPEEAHKYVLGYSGFNDGSVRDFQLQHCPAAGKNFDRSSSFGPWITTKDEIIDVKSLFITTRLNGEVVQRDQIGELLIPVEALVSYFSRIFYLQPGDVITTGTCAGVGFFRKPQVFLKVGDKLEIEVDGVGIMKHDVINEI